MPAFFRASDGVELYLRHYPHAGRALGTILVIPGTGGPLPRDYEPVSKRLREANWRVIVVHVRGTGFSNGPRGDIPDFDRILEDLRELCFHLQEPNADRPLVLLGHSIGGTLATVVAQDCGAGVVLVNPAYRLAAASEPSLGDWLGHAWNYLFHRSTPTVSMARSPDDVAHPRDRAEARARLVDPLVVKHYSTRYLMAVGELLEGFPDAAARVAVPLLLLQGAEDAVIDPSGSQEILAAWGGSPKRLVLLPAVGHGLHLFETGVTQILRWLDVEMRRPGLTVEAESP